MPIYAYKCSACGFAQDVLQKISDERLTVCPSCQQPSFSKQLTAAGFQLKGSGWYATDFRNQGTAPAAPSTETPKSTSDTPSSPPSSSEASTSSTSTSSASISSNGCATGCACH